MQQSSFFEQLDLPTSISRTAKDGSNSFTKIDNRALNPIRADAGLRRGDRAVHLRLLTLPDDWNFSTVVHWVAEREAVSLRTAYRIMARLEKAGLVPRCWHQKVRENTRHVFEVACPDRPQGTDASKRHVVMANKATHRRQRGRGKGQTRFPSQHGCLVVNTPEQPFSAPREVVSNLTPLQRTKVVLHSSEQPSTPSAPEGAPGVFDELRVRCNDGKPAPDAKPARRAKRQKGRSSQGKPHNARQMNRKQQLPRLSKLAINAAAFRATPDAEEFMLNLPTQLKPAIAALRALPEDAEYTRPWIDALMENPLLSVAQDVLGYASWGARELRSFVNSLGARIPVNDLLLCWIGMKGCWSHDTVCEMRYRLLNNRRPTAPDHRRSQIQPDLMMQVHTWQQHLDEVRDVAFADCTRPVSELLAGVDLDDPESIKTHPMIWTAILASPLAPEEFIDEEVVELARQSLVPVDREEFLAWIADQSERLHYRWNGRFCVEPLETLVGRGICKAVEEWYEFGLVDKSGKRGSRGDYTFVTSARTATISHFD